MLSDTFCLWLSTVSSLLFVLLLSCRTSWSSEELFLVKPGDGEAVFYSPAGVNTTLYCTVNNTNLFWIIYDHIYIDLAPELHSRGIFLGTIVSHDGTRMSSVRVLGDRVLNSNTSICCETAVKDVRSRACTTLIIFERPSPPERLSAQYVGDSSLINISWAAETVRGVTQNYSIFFDHHMPIKTAVPHFVYEQNISDSKIICIAFIIAVNGAGESDPSDNVTIPSLPDIGPVMASLTHQVWKSRGNIMVNVSFKPALFCAENPVSSYLLRVKPLVAGDVIEVCLDANETYTVLEPAVSLKADHKYVYTVTALNVISNTTSTMDEKLLITSDLQALCVKVVGESTIEVYCQFIQGSDALGCKIVLISVHPNVNSEQAILPRNNTHASGRINLTKKASCYHQITAFHIDHNKKVSNVSIEEKIMSTTSVLCSSK